MKEILVIGSGVIGLTTALSLQEAGYTVDIISKDLPPQTTSAKAAAIWFPFKVAPVEKVNQWSLESYHRFVELAKNPKSGVSMIDFLVLAPDGGKPEWVDALPQNALRLASKSELPATYEYGHQTRVPLIETPIYLNFLLKQFYRNGGNFYQESVQSLNHLLAPNRILINCTGLGAASLTGDTSLYPIAGQIVKIEVQEGSPCLADDEGPNALAYIIPRRDCIVLGGTTDKGQYKQHAQAETTAQIIERCRQLAPGLDFSKLVAVEVGLRPARPEIRLEADPDKELIHNYGHGGGGFTVSWGCASEVLQLLNLLLAKNPSAHVS